MRIFPQELRCRRQAPYSCTAPAAEGILQELMQLERSINSLDIHQPPRAGCHRLCFDISTTHAPTCMSYYVAAPGLRTKVSETDRNSKKHNYKQLPTPHSAFTRFALPLEWNSWLCFREAPLQISQK